MAQSQAAGGVSAPGLDPGRALNCSSSQAVLLKSGQHQDTGMRTPQRPRPVGICSEASPSKTLTLRKEKKQVAENPNQQTEEAPAVDNGAREGSVGPCIITQDTLISGQSLGHITSPLCVKWEQRSGHSQRTGKGCSQDWEEWSTSLRCELPLSDS